MNAQPARRFGIARFIMCLTGAIAMGLAAAAVLIFMGLQNNAPQVGRLPPPTPEDARYAQIFMLTMEHIGRQPDRAGDVSGTLEEFNGLFRILARSNEDLRLHADVDGGAVRLDASARLPGHEWAGWLNVTAVAVPFSGALQIESLRLGRIPLPPEASLRFIAWGIDRRFGDGAGAQALRIFEGLSVEDDVLTFDLNMPLGSERILSRNAISEIYGRDMVSRARVAEEVTFLEREVADGRLQRDGSFAPWVRTVIARAAEAPADGTADAVMAGFMALNYLCGSDHFVAVLLPPTGTDQVRMPSSRPGCGRAELHERVDLRRHFTTAATIKLISNRGAAVAAGEAKELSDMISAGGFDFTDVLANNSGIRLAMLLDGASPEELRALAAAITSEDTIIADLQGIPRIMERSAFRMRFGDIDSPEYRAVLDEIEARIDRLPIHSGAPASGQGG